MRFFDQVLTFKFCVQRYVVTISLFLNKYCDTPIRVKRKRHRPGYLPLSFCMRWETGFARKQSPFHETKLLLLKTHLLSYTSSIFHPQVAYFLSSLANFCVIYDHPRHLSVGIILTHQRHDCVVLS